MSRIGIPDTDTMGMHPEVNSYCNRYKFANLKMNVYKNLSFPLLKKLDAEHAHERTLTALAWGQRFAPWMLRHIAGSLPINPVDVCGLTFPNAIGMAAGFDKEVRVVEGLATLGFGHIEVGTLTPKPQAGNPRPRIFRLPKDNGLINRMGFPNGGVKTAVFNLSSLPADRNYIIGVSLGKQKETPLAEAASDYRIVMQAVYPYADYLAVNISSPNTPGLRELQGGDYLRNLLAKLQEENNILADGGKRKPLLVKIAPDLTWAELDDILQTISDEGIDGIIATNTTVSRDGLQDKNQKETGGLSGRPLRQRSTEIIQYVNERMTGRLPIIGAGGINTATDVKEKLEAGASLVQLYTGLVYEGPGLVGQLVRNNKQ